MRDYEEFAARLRQEIEAEDLGSGELRVAPPQRDARRVPAAARALAAAALLAAAGIGIRAGTGALESRRVVTSENREFVDSLFARGLFEAGAAPLPEAALDWAEASVLD